MDFNMVKKRKGEDTNRKHTGNKAQQMKYKMQCDIWN